MCSVFGHHYKHFGIYLSRGFIDQLAQGKLTQRELKAVLLHELFHVQTGVHHHGTIFLGQEAGLMTVVFILEFPDDCLE